MNGYGSHTFKMVNDKNEAVYCKFHFKVNIHLKKLQCKTLRVTTCNVRQDSIILANLFFSKGYSFVEKVFFYIRLIKFSSLCTQLKHVIFTYFFQTDQGIKNLSADKAAQLAGEDPDYAIRDLYNAIEQGNNPSWTAYIQVMTFEEAEKWEFNPFDLTKVLANTII